MNSEKSKVSSEGCSRKSWIQLESNNTRISYKIVMQEVRRAKEKQRASNSGFILQAECLAFRASQVFHDTHSALSRNDVSASLMNGQRIRLSPVPPKKTHKNRIIGSICPFLPPRDFGKCPSIMKIDGRGGGDRKQYRLEFQGL